MITVKNISHFYKNNDHNQSKDFVLNNVNFQIKNKQIISLLGKSGSGKTTLANILAGYIKPSDGIVKINQKIQTQVGKNRILVNQENDLFNWMTISQNIEIFTKDNKLINKYLKLVDLDKYRNQYPDCLSGGMKKKLSIARALSVNPKFLILDEPFSSIDYHTKQLLYLELEKIFTRIGSTVLLITHDIEEAIFLSDRILILDGKPASIKDEIVINFSHPRKNSIKTNKRFNQIKREIQNKFHLNK